LKSRSWGSYQNSRAYVKLRALKARSSSRLGGLESVVSSPSGVWSGAQETEAILSISSQNWVHWYILESCKSQIFNNQIEKIAD